ncbi:MAG: glycosyltransferase [Chloroflexi bacterium]|nr:MAG: glycosyltransferase [Chloroflexota bacterium]
MKIGFVSTRLAGVDGVSLETAKLVTILQRNGHECFYCAGQLSDAPGTPQGRLVPPMHFTDPLIKQLHDEAFGLATRRPDLYDRIFDVADELRAELQMFVEQFGLDMIISQNASAIPMNLPLGVAIRDLAERTRIPVICHNHDFYWERERFIVNHVQDILNTAFPPHAQTVSHLVINSPMQRDLYLRRNIQATYLPNVFDFANPPAAPDDYARSFREDMGLTDDDIIFMQATRIIRRKGIEKAIELVRKLNDDRVILLIAGDDRDDGTGYGAWLREEADRAGIRYRFIGDWLGDSRGERDGHKVYALWDIYPHADIITYPSIYEGFGNAFVEAMYFQKPVVVRRYAIYKSNIEPTGVRTVAFDYDITDDTLQQTRQLMTDKSLRQEIAEHNYAIGTRHFSYETLEAILMPIVEQASR